MQDHLTLEAVAMIRDEAQADFFKKMNVQTVIANLEDDTGTIAKAEAGCDAIVFTAGSGPHTGEDKTLLVEVDGPVKTREAAKRANIERYSMMSSFDTTRAATQNAPESWAPYGGAAHYAHEWTGA